METKHLSRGHSTHQSRGSLKDRESSEFPVCRRESRSVGCRVFSTCAWTAVFRSVNVGVSGPVATNLYIYYYRLVLEVAINIATSIREIGQRLSPRRRVWCLSRDIGGYAITSELPYPNTGGPQFHGHDSPSVVVEDFSVGSGFPVHATSSVGVGSVIAVCCRDAADLFAFYTLHGTVL